MQQIFSNRSHREIIEPLLYTIHMGLCGEMSFVYCGAGVASADDDAESMAEIIKFGCDCFSINRLLPVFT